MKYVDIRVTFEENEEDLGEGDIYTYLTPTKVEAVGNNFDFGHGYDVAETAGQSDFYQIDVSNAFLRCLDGTSSVYLYTGNPQ